jgi:ketosteroid isomerase-like protein
MTEAVSAPGDDRRIQTTEVPDMDRETFQRWLDQYVAAWRSNDAEQIGALFSDDVVYRYRPYTEPVRGRAAIVADWLRDPDDPASWDAEYHAVAVDGDTGVSVGESRYPSEGKAYSNVFIVRFDDDGRAREFSEWWVEKPKPKG